MTPLSLLVLASTPLHSSGMPRIEVLTPRAEVRTVWHRARIELDRKQTVYSGSSLLRNLGDKQAEIKVMVPVVTHGGTPPTTSVSGKWGDKETAPGSPEPGPQSGGTTVHWRPFKVSLAAKSWKVFESRLALPLQRGGEGKAERQVLFSVPPQKKSLEQFQLSIVYPRDLVFQMVGTQPKRGWEIGPTGAWWQARDWKPEATVLSFRFYPGTFEPIGD